MESAVDRIEFLENCTKLSASTCTATGFEGWRTCLTCTSWRCCHWRATDLLMENLEHLKELRNLNLANNVISVIGDSLAGLTKLETLNLAGNRMVPSRRSQTFLPTGF